MSDTDLTDLVRIEDPAFYAEDPHPVFARLRHEAPVFWYEPLETWVLTKYEDLKYVGTTPEIFSNTGGVSLNDIKYGGVINSFFGAENIGTTDPPRHRELRRVIAPSVTPSSVKEMEPTMRQYTRELLDRIVPGEPVRFVHEIGAVLPLQVISQVMGIPGDNIADLKFWSDETLKFAAALDVDGINQARANAAQMEAFLNEWMVRKLGEDSNDMICTMLKARLGGAAVSYENLHMFLKAVLVAGNETTRDFLSGTMLTFIEHPDQLERLVADPTLISGALEECLRWVTPVRGFIRTVLHDTQIRGQEIKSGHHVHLLWMAANRDEDAWPDADVFDVARKPEPMHEAFGFGEHACLGRAIARLESRIFLEELLQRFPRWELAGEPERPNSVLHNSFEELPLVFFTR